MELEEKAERYATNSRTEEEKKVMENVEIYGCSDHKEREESLRIAYITEGKRLGYIAGAKENGNVWHDLTKNPDDLPIEPDILKNEPESHRYEWFIVAGVGKSMRALYSFAKEKWFIDYEEMRIGANYFEPIAWCDFPQFER